MLAARTQIPDDNTDTSINYAASSDPDRILAQMVALVPGILYVFNHQNQSNEYSNLSFAAMLGYAQQDIRELGDTFLARVIHREDLDGIGRYFASLHTLKDGESSKFEYRALCRDGSTVWLRCHDSVFDRAPDGSVLRHISVAQDVTAEKLATLGILRKNSQLETRIVEGKRASAALNDDLESRVEARTRDLTEANEELEQLTYIAMHDLKVPINNMCRLAEMLAVDCDTLSTSQAETAQWMKTATEQAHRKLNALGDVAKARSTNPGKAQEVRLAAVLATTSNLLAHEIAQDDVTIHADFSRAETVSYDPAEVESIFDNLIGNAIKYARPGVAPILTLASWKEEGKVCLSVADNGTGLSLPEDEEKVFGLFRRAHKSPPGSGVALYTIRKRLIRGGGSIALSSEIGAGSTFTLCFPSSSPQGGF